jgi:hypothetical protein
MHCSKTTKKDVNRGLLDVWFIEEEYDAEHESECLDEPQSPMQERDELCSLKTNSLT